MQSRYPYKPSKNELAAFQQKNSWLFDELSDNNALDDGLSLSASVAVNKQILEVIPTPGMMQYVRERRKKLLPGLSLLQGADSI